MDIHDLAAVASRQLNPVIVNTKLEVTALLADLAISTQAGLATNTQAGLDANTQTGLAISTQADLVASTLVVTPVVSTSAAALVVSTLAAALVASTLAGLVAVTSAGSAVSTFVNHFVGSQDSITYQAEDIFKISLCLEQARQLGRHPRMVVYQSYYSIYIKKEII